MSMMVKWESTSVRRENRMDSLESTAVRKESKMAR